MSDQAHPTIATLMEHTQFVRGIAYALLRGDAEADDVVQETWLAALTSGPGDPRKLRAWLAGVSRKKSLMLLRGRARRLKREMREAEAKEDQS